MVVVVAVHHRSRADVFGVTEAPLRAGSPAQTSSRLFGRSVDMLLQFKVEPRGDSIGSAERFDARDCRLGRSRFSIDSERVVEASCT